MKLQYVKLKNFKSYPDQETTVDLSFDGIKLLVAENGDGKSTIFDAIIWAIYGKNKDGVDGVVNRTTKKNCKVEVAFRVGSNDYSIIRYRKHDTNGNKLLFFKGSKNVSQRTAGATQEAIEEVIEIQYNTMISSVVLSSELYTSFLRSSRADRLKTFESILSLKEITLFYNKLKKLKEPIDELVTNTNMEREKAEVAISSLTGNIDEYKEGVKKTLRDFKIQKENLQDEVFKLTKKIAEYDEINVDQELTNNEAYDIISKKNIELNDKIREESDKIVDVQELIDEREEFEELLAIKESVDVQKEIAAVYKYEEDTAENSKINESINKLLFEMKDCTPLINSLKKAGVKRRALTEEIESIQAHINECPTCHQAVDKKLTESLIDKKEEERRIIVEAAEKETEELKASEAKNKKIGEANIVLGGKLRETFPPKYTKEFLNKLKDDISDLETKILLCKKDINNSEETNTEILSRIGVISKEVKKNEENISTPAYHTVFLNDLKKKIVLLKDEAEEKRMLIETIDIQAKSSYDKGYIDNTLITIGKLNKKLASTKKKLQKAIVEKNHYEVLLAVFSNKEEGFKKFFIHKMISMFNDRVNFYLPFFFDEDIDIEFDKDLNEIIKVNKEEVSFASFSSGQKTRFDIAISFSLFFMVKMFFSSTINLLVFDEILDMNLDKKGFNSVYDIIQNLGEYNTVFVVSHQEFYKEKFSHHIHIKRNKQGFSYIYNEV